MLLNNFTFLSYLDKYPELFWSSLFYNVGIWVCNFVIWFGDGRGNIEDTFIYHQIYDTSVFWAYLSIIPTYIFFVVSIETRFYERYKKFFGSVNNGGTLHTLLQLKDSMNFVLKQEMERILRNQGIFSLLIIFIIWMFSSQSGKTTLNYSILQLTIVGAYANGMVLVITLLLLYFEDRKGAFRTSAIFFFANLLLSLSCFHLDSMVTALVSQLDLLLHSYMLFLGSLLTLKILIIIHFASQIFL